MNPALTAAGIKGLTGVFSSLFGGGGGGRATDDAARLQSWGWKHGPNQIRKGAERAGFNPLTVMGSSFAGANFMNGAASSAPLATGRILAETVGDILLEATGTNDALEAEREKAELDRLRKENEILNAGGAGETVTRTVRTINVGGTDTPKAEPDFMDQYMANPSGYTQMRNIAGKAISVRNDVLARLELPPGSLYGVAEDAEMVFGEIGGEVTGVGNLGDDLAGHLDGTNIVKRGGAPTLTKEPVPAVVPPAVKYPSVTSVPAHQNPTDIENILKHRYKKDEDDTE